ncbi:hypothetical protein GCM10027517_32550 [Phycicoccus ginsengisoli]
MVTQGSLEGMPLIRHTTLPGYRCGLTTDATRLRTVMADPPELAHEVVDDEP